jgi:hypothetical protein
MQGQVPRPPTAERQAGSAQGAQVTGPSQPAHTSTPRRGEDARPVSEPLRDSRSEQERASATPSPEVVDQAIEAAHRLNAERPQSRPLESPEFEEVAAGLRAAVGSRTDAAKDLESAGRNALAALKEDELKEREGDDADWRERLREPAQQLLDGLDALLADDKLWERLRAGETATAVFTPHSRRVLREVLDVNLDQLLQAMNVESDQAKRLSQGLRAALDDLVESKSDEAMRADSTRSAQQHIAYVTYRLRRALDATKPQGRNVDAGQDSEPARPERLRIRLRAAMRDGAQIALPAAVAAGAANLAFPSADHAAPVAGGVAVGIAAKELFSKAVQFAATELMRRPPTAMGSPATPAERFEGARRRVDTALSDCVARLSNLKDSADPLKERLSECLRIESVSSLYGLQQAQLEYSPKGHHAVRAVTDSILDSLRHAGNLIGTLDRNPDELSAVVETLKAQRRELRDLLQAI